MSRVLLVDTNFSAGPIYQFLVKAGYRVTVVGGNPNDSLAKSVDDYVNLDYSDVNAMRRLIEELKINYLVPGCNDHSYMICAEINTERRYRGIDTFTTAEIINNKAKFRAFSRAHGLPTPRLLGKEEIGRRWPVIVKPVDAFSGRGITVLHESDKALLSSALNQARTESKSGECIVEDFVEGQLYSHTAFIQKGNVLKDYIVEEHGTASRFTVDTSRVCHDFPKSILKSIRDNIRIIAKKLLLEDGLVHTQFICKKENYWLIEITRRCPGDLYSQLIELSTGCLYAENYARPFIGLPFKFTRKTKPRMIMRHTLSQPVAYTFANLSFNRPLRIINLTPISTTGDRLNRSPYGRIGIIFAEEIKKNAFKNLIAITRSRKLYQVQP